MVEQTVSEPKNDASVPSLFILLILTALTGFVPLVVYFRPVQYTGIIQEIFRKDLVPDFFFYYKSAWIQILSATGLIWFAIYRRNSVYHFRRSLVIYGGMCVLSTVFAPNRDLALWGDPMRFEGMFTHLSYMAVAFLFEAVLTTRRALRFVFAGTVCSIGVVSLLGFLQFFGFDYFGFCLTKSLLIPGYYLESSISGWETIKNVLVDNTVFLTFGNRNFSGSYLSMAFPFMLALSLGLKGWMTVPARFITLMLYVAFLGCNARAAHVSGLAGTVIMAVFMFRELKSRWRLTVAFLLLGALIPFIMDAYTLRKGYPRFFYEAFGRPVSHNIGSCGIFRDLKLHENTAEADFDGFVLRVAVQSSELAFFEKSGEKVLYQALRGVTGNASETQTNNASIAGIRAGAYHAQSIQVASLSENPGAMDEDEDNIVFIDQSKLKDGITGNVFLAKFPLGKFPGYEVLIWPDNGILRISRGGGEGLYLGFYGNGFKVIDQYGNAEEPRQIESWGFSGKEGWGSGRGYLWARTIPLLKRTWLLGYGPDTFVAHFPQYDTLGKLRYWNSGRGLIFEKPHNHYLQTGVNIGGTGLLAIMLLWAGYLLASAKTYWKCDCSDNLEVAGVAVFAGVVAYLVNCIFNDSVVGVAQIFWALLGMGLAINKLIHENLAAKDALPSVLHDKQ